MITDTYNDDCELVQSELHTDNAHLIEYRGREGSPEGETEEKQGQTARFAVRHGSVQHMSRTWPQLPKWGDRADEADTSGFADPNVSLPRTVPTCMRNWQSVHDVCLHGGVGKIPHAHGRENMGQ